MADDKGLIRCVFNRPLHGLPLEVTADPSDKSLGLLSTVR
jgi:hypothetical protein